MKEAKLGITDEAVEVAVQRVESFEREEDLLRYMRSMLERMHAAQPHLYIFVKESVERRKLDPFFSGLGAAITFDILSQNHMQPEITETTLSVVDQNFQEHFNIEEGIDLDWFQDKLEEDAPGYTKVIGHILSELETQGEKHGFYFGAMHVVMPYFVVGEAKIMERRFFPEVR